MHQRKGEGIIRHTGDESLRRLQELVSQPGALTFVPPVGLIKPGFRFISLFVLRLSEPAQAAEHGQRTRAHVCF
jgi:hypothetical protein